MAELVVFTSVTIDGVMQAPGRPDEDRRGGFQHGGWAVPYASEEQGKAASEAMGTTAGIVLGRRTYEDFASFWPKQTEPNSVHRRPEQHPEICRLADIARAITVGELDTPPG
jgi:hypothetical protein